MLDTNDIKGQQKLHVRLASDQTDLTALRQLSLELHAEGRFAHIPYSMEKRDAMFSKALDRPGTYALLIAEISGKPVGFLFCTISEYIVGTEDLLTTVYSFFVSKQYRKSILGGKISLRLLNGAMKWSRVRKSREIMIHVTSGVDLKRVDRFLRRTGFSVTGANYALSLQ